MIYTSYFSKNANHPDAISIAGKSPAFYNGPEYKKLAPQYSWWKEWKEQSLSDEEFIEKYYSTVLDQLDVHEVTKELDGKILLCWESPEKFCHRHVVAGWLEANGYRCEEV